MRMTQVRNHRRWKLEDIPFHDIDVKAVRTDEFLLATLASASFVEILAQTYSANLIQHFLGMSEITDWLETHWQPEETQHGQALKAYVNFVWPEFDWDSGHARFRAEYAACCTVEQLEPQPALELIARCVVETGTSTFYRALHNYTKEPVLRDLIEKIKMDEAAHYTFFRRQFTLLNTEKQYPASAVIATIWRRVREVRGEDTYIAFRHVHDTRHPDAPFQEVHWRAYNKQAKQLARRHFPYKMAIHMLLKPVPLRATVKHSVSWFLVGAAWLASIG